MLDEVAVVDTVGRGRGELRQGLAVADPHLWDVEEPDRQAPVYLVEGEPVRVAVPLG